MTAKTEKATSPTKEAAEVEKLSIFEALAVLGEAAQVAVYREPGRKYLEVCGVDGLDEEMMRERYGGGKFSLAVRENGKFMKGQPVRHVTIEGPPKTFPPLPPGVDPVAAVEMGRMRGELEAMKAGKNGGGNSDMLAIVTLLAPAVTAMLESVVNRPPPPPPPDPIATLDLYRKMLKDDRKEAKDNAPSESGLDPLVEKLGLPLLGHFDRLKAQEEGGTVKNPDQLPAPALKKPESLPELAAFMARWCAAPCAKGADPELRAELFMEELRLQESELYESVAQLSRVDNILEHWTKLVPAVGLNREWHGSFITEIRAIADEPAEATDSDSGGTDPEGGRGDDGNASGNGETVEAGSADA